MYERNKKKLYLQTCLDSSEIRSLQNAWKTAQLEKTNYGRPDNDRR